jgi:hypothetical protein
VIWSLQLQQSAPTHKRIRDDVDRDEENDEHRGPSYSEKKDMATCDTLAAMLLFNNVALQDIMGRETIITHATVGVRVRAGIPENFSTSFWCKTLISAPFSGSRTPRQGRYYVPPYRPRQRLAPGISRIPVLATPAEVIHGGLM